MLDCPFPVATHLIAAILGASVALAVVVPSLTHHQTAVAIAAERATSAAMIAAHQRVHGIEAEAQAGVGKLTLSFQQELSNAQINQKQLADRVRAGAVRLRIADSTCDRNPGAGPAGPASGDHETATAELSATATQFLLDLTGEADQVSLQLGACQSLATTLRAACRTTP
jgi:hypothetical protein